VEELASSLKEALLASDAETKEMIENTFRTTSPKVMTLDQLSDHVDDEVPVVTAFNVGQGDSYLISLPAGKDGKGNMTHGFVLIDAGASGTEGMVAGGGCRHAAPDACVCDADHVGGAVTVVEQFKMQRSSLPSRISGETR
jgi:hypothetical protein